MKVFRSLVFLFMSLTWICLHLNCVIGLTKSEKWPTYRSFDRMALHGEELWTKHVRSRLECVSLCNAENECDATFFHTTLKQCKGASKSKITWENMIKDEDMRFNYKGHPCFGGYYYIGNKCYMYVATSVSQEDAVSICTAKGGYLLQINDESELNGLVSAGTDVGFWIDGNDKQNEGTFTYTGGERMTFYSWSVNEPSGNLFGNEDCIMLKRDTMNDFPCTNKLPFICEKD